MNRLLLTLTLLLSSCVSTGSGNGSEIDWNRAADEIESFAESAALYQEMVLVPAGRVDLAEDVERVTVALDLLVVAMRAGAAEPGAQFDAVTAAIAAIRSRVDEDDAETLALLDSLEEALHSAPGDAVGLTLDAAIAALDALMARVDPEDLETRTILFFVRDGLARWRAAIMDQGNSAPGAAREHGAQGDSATRPTASSAA